MRSLLPVKLLDEIVAEANDPQILSEMLIAVHGPQLLEKAKNILSSKGLRPPGMWAGSQTAIQFISELGFEGSGIRISLFPVLNFPSLINLSSISLAFLSACFLSSEVFISTPEAL